MTPVTVWGLKSCDTCRRARRDLPGCVFVDIREATPDTATLARFHAAFGDAMVNRRSRTWRDIPEDERELPPPTLVARYPSVMKRPVIEKDGVLRVGFDDEVRRALGL